MVCQGAMQHAERILCAACIDVCPRDVITYSFSGGGQTT
jgi:ferredoxin